MQCPHDKAEMRCTWSESTGNGFFDDSDETVHEGYVCPVCAHEFAVSYAVEGGAQATTASMSDLTADEIWVETPHGEWVRHVPQPPASGLPWG